MIGIIVTGHGYFADGLTSAIELIMGEQSFYQKLNFPQASDPELLGKQLKEAIDVFSACDRILICCDLFHGTPFNQAMLLALSMDKVDVIYGVNVGMMMELLMNRMQERKSAELIETALETGRQQIGRFHPEDIHVIDEVDDPFTI